MERHNAYRELEKNEKKGRDYQIRFRQGKSGIAVIAPHGGGIEPGTTEIADAVAGDAHDYYSFEGLKHRGNLELHMTSRHFDEPIGMRIVRISNAALVIHGCKGEEIIVYIGGRDEILKEIVTSALEDFGFSVQENPRFPGKSPLNICNRSRLGKGVQLEITWELRRRMFQDLARAKRKSPTKLFGTFVLALRNSLSEYVDLGKGVLVSRASS
jgi:phage replication-related protein YjqB (UPF0714/DUF867 family)